MRFERFIVRDRIIRSQNILENLKTAGMPQIELELQKLKRKGANSGNATQA